MVYLIIPHLTQSFRKEQMNGTQTVYYFVSDSSLQSSLLKEKLESIINISIFDTTFPEFILKIKNLEKQTSIVSIIDHNCFNDEMLIEYISAVESANLSSKEVLINADQNIGAEYLIKLPCAIGLFYQYDDLQQMSLGMNKIMGGDLWFSRQMSNDLIQLFRKQKIYTSNIIVDLTNREKEIMNLLSLGASNNEIATELVVSENTVKTHLHNVFKKIKVRNRLQAVMWAKGQAFNNAEH